ncbi:ABC transporter ATP-binding protein [Actinomycetota bacterium]
MTAALLSCSDLALGYRREEVCRDITVDFRPAALTAVVGPNGCGKSTLLKGLGGALRPMRGEVMLDGRPVTAYRPKEAARTVATLPQNPVVPEQITVRELVARGRYPYHSMLRTSSADDARAIQAALAQTGTEEIADRPVAELSGGQRQRVWLALVLAQDTPVVLLDEPTTFLDIAHQHEVLELCTSLRDSGRTVVAIMHDLGQAAAFADDLVMMRDGRVIAQGAPAAVLTPDRVEQTFGLRARIVADPDTGTPLVLPPL